MHRQATLVDSSPFEWFLPADQGGTISAVIIIVMADDGESRSNGGDDGRGDDDDDVDDVQLHAPSTDDDCLITSTKHRSCHFGRLASPWWWGR